MRVYEVAVHATNQLTHQGSKELTLFWSIRLNNIGPPKSCHSPLKRRLFAFCFTRKGWCWRILIQLQQLERNLFMIPVSPLAPAAAGAVLTANILTGKRFNRCGSVSVGSPAPIRWRTGGRVLQSVQYLLDQIRGQQHNLPSTNHVLHTGITQPMLRRPNQRPLASPCELWRS